MILAVILRFPVADFLTNPPTVIFKLPPGCISGSAAPVWPRVIMYVGSTYVAVPEAAQEVGYAAISPRGLPTLVTSHFQTTPVTVEGRVARRLNAQAACDAVVGFDMVTTHCTG